MLTIVVQIEMVPVVAHDIIGRLMIQCARQSGLAFVFSHIFQFDGNEIYIKEWPELVGRHFEQVLQLSTCSSQPDPAGLQHELAPAGADVRRGWDPCRHQASREHGRWLAHHAEP